MDRKKALERLNCPTKSEANKVALSRINAVVDADSFVETAAAKCSEWGVESVVTGYATVNGLPVCVYAEDFANNGAAMNMSHARKIIALLDMAVSGGMPVVIIPDSLGGELCRGAELIEAYAAVSAKLAALSGVVPVISMVMGKLYGLSAVLALTADIVIARKDARIAMMSDAALGLTGAKGVDEIDCKNGYVSISCEDDDECANALRNLITIMPSNNLSPAFEIETDDDHSRYCPELDAIAAGDGNYDPTDVVKALADEGTYIELKADFAKNIKTYLALVGSKTVGVVATAPNANVCARCAGKAEAFVKFCDAYSIPVITLVDTKGFVVSKEEDEKGALMAQARLMATYANATTLKIALITGVATGAAYAAFGSKALGVDMAYAWGNAVISPLAIPAALDVFYKDELINAKNSPAMLSALEDKYIAEYAGADSAAACGAIDSVIIPGESRKYITYALEMLEAKRVASISRKHSSL
ncbi:MAG: hypothetical protein E7315_00265 [Clostridiales bacterium]|nr:hypothetical protein [Clostridiales bacterium]